MEVRLSRSRRLPIDPSDTQLQKAALPMETRPLEKEIDNKKSQLKNAYLPMEVRLLGRVIVFRAWQFVKALSPMEVTPSGTTTWPAPSIGYGEPDPSRQHSAVHPVTQSRSMVMEHSMWALALRGETG